MATNNCKNNLPWNLIQSQIVSGTPATLTFTTGITSSYTTYVIIIAGVTPSSNDSLIMRVSTNGGSSYIATGYQSGALRTQYNSTTTASPNSTTSVTIGGTLEATSGGGMNGELFCFNFNNGNTQAYVASLAWFSSTPITDMAYFGGTGPGTTTVNALQFSWAGGNNFVAGTISLYGLQ